MKYQRKPEIVEATQWFALGDYKNDEPFCVSYNETPCPACGRSLSSHGCITGFAFVVCPSNWIVTGPNGEIGVVKDSEFKEMYEVVG